MNNLWFKMNPLESEDQPRLHHQLSPNTLEFEKDFDQVMYLQIFSVLLTAFDALDFTLNIVPGIL